EADMAMLNRFSPARRALKVKELKFREFFDWLSGSLIKASQSGPGEKVKLDVDSIQGWGEL
ncbi:MAG: hypothetical protein IJK97_01250, partial [Thermoguttaceae bacterium]|nr:hypothetical protein [Thermoguttaceae bacterium]